MNKKTATEDKTIIMSDDSLRESGLQGGKIIAEHIALGCFIMGIPFFLIGIYALISMVFGLGYPTNTAIIIVTVLVTIIGVLLIVSGYSIHHSKQVKK